MAPPVFPILYWRDNSTRTALTAYDSAEKLLAAKPAQCLVFDTDDRMLEHILESGDDPVTNEPALNPDGKLTVYKQQGRSSVPTITLEGNCGIAEAAWRDQLRTFSRKAQIEPQHHKFGILGLWSPDVPDFDLDPTDTIGYTMALPVFEYFSPSEIIHYRINLSMGAFELT